MIEQQIKIQVYQVRESNKRITKDIFNKIKNNYRVEIHKITIEDLEEISSKKVHLLIFDNIPCEDIDFALIDMIQKNNKHLHTMFVKENIDEIHAIKLYQKNIDYLCESLYGNEYIVALLTSILKRKSSKYFIESVINYKDIKVDLITHEVFVNQEIVETSKKEFKLIRFLVKNNENFLSKGEIFKEVWGYEEDVSRTLDQYLHRIKEKIGNNVLLVKDKSGRVKML